MAPKSPTTTTTTTTKTKTKKQQKKKGPPSPTSLLSLLSSCAARKDLRTGMSLHAFILAHGLLLPHSHGIEEGASSFLANAVISMYAKCGALGPARHAFQALESPDVVAWNAMISGFASHGQGAAALSCFDRMLLRGIMPDSVTFICVLRACGSARGREVHARVAQGFLLLLPESRRALHIRNALIDMYAKCGMLGKAREMLEEQQALDVVSWTSLIGGYAQGGCDDAAEALRAYEQMLIQGILPNVVTWVCILNACRCSSSCCCYMEASNQGKRIHAAIVALRLLPNDLVLGNALIDMYAKSGIVEEARRVSDELPVRDVVTWTASIAGYVDCGRCEEALCMFRRMQIEGFSPNAITHACILKACGNIGSMQAGQEIHVTVGGGGGGSAAEEEISIGNALLGMYAKCGDFARAREVFCGLPDPDAVSWNTLIGGYVQHGLGEEALDCRCLERMQSSGICFTEATFACVLAACAKVGALEQGRRAHMDAVRIGFFGTCTAVGNALVDMYARCGLLGAAQAVFDSLPIQDVVSWNILVAGYAEHGYGEEALSCADSMRLQGIAPDAITHLGALSGCARSVAACRGQETHASIAKMGSNDAQSNALIDMYAACGMLAEARHVFGSLPSSRRSACSWTSLIAAYAQFGDDAAARNLFDKMLKEGKGADAIVLTALLASCSHSGSIGLAQMYFETLIEDCGMIPTLENHVCMVDAFGRAGQLERMKLLIEEMPFCADSTLWHAALHSCRGRGDVELGSWAFQHALQLDAEDASAYVCIRNMYAVQSAT